MKQYTLLKNKIETNSTWEGAFYVSEWDKINPSWVLFKFIHFMRVAANASVLFCAAHLENIEHFLYHSNLSFYASNFI